MLALESYNLEETQQNASTARYNVTVVEYSLTVLVTTLQWSVAFGFIVAIISAGSWSVQHQWVGYSVFILSVLCTAINIHRAKMNVSTSLIQKEASSGEAGVSHRLQRRTGITLLVLMGITIISGWMFTLDSFWGLLWIEDVHNLAAYTTAGLLFLYCAMALYFNHRNNHSE